MEKNETHVKSVERALQVLTALSEENKDVSLTEISNKLGWPKSTAHGILSTLREYRFVDQSAETGRYRLGVRLFELGHKVGRNWDIRETALPVLQSLNGKFGEMVQLATEDAGEVLYIEKIDSTQIIRIVSDIGKRLPMYCTGLGKVLLAYQTPAEVKRILSKSGMPGMTRRTITGLLEMTAELAKIRRQGYAVDDQEIMEGLRCVAAPIRDVDGAVRYAVSVSGLAERLTGEYFERVRDAVVVSAAEISRLMGYKERNESLMKE